jgi:hypothetical protein
VSVPAILDRTRPGVVVVQDKCRWDGNEGTFRDPDAWFADLSALRGREDVLKVAVLKDAQQLPDYHRWSAGARRTWGSMHGSFTTIHASSSILRHMFALSTSSGPITASTLT